MPHINEDHLHAPMPTRSERQQAAHALHHAFLVNIIINFEAQAWDMDSDEDLDSSDSSDSNSSTSSSSDSHSSSASSSSSGSDDQPTPAEHYVDAMAELYSQRYLHDQGEINKSTALLHLLLDDYKYNHPEIFCSYL